MAIGFTVSVVIEFVGCVALVIVLREFQKDGSRCRPAVQRVVFCVVVLITRLKFRFVLFLSGKDCV